MKGIEPTAKYKLPLSYFAPDYKGEGTRIATGAEIKARGKEIHQEYLASLKGSYQPIRRFETETKRYPPGTKFVPTEEGYKVIIPESAQLEASERMLKKSEKYPPVLREIYQFQQGLQGLFSSWGIGGKKSRIAAVPGKGLMIGAKQEKSLVPQHPVDVVSGVTEYVGWAPKGSRELLGRYPAFTAGSIGKEIFGMYAFGKVLQPVTAKVSKLIHKGKYVGKELIPGTSKITKVPTKYGELIIKKVPYTINRKIKLTAEQMTKAHQKLTSKLGQKTIDITFPMIRTAEGGKKAVATVTQEWYKRSLRGLTRYYRGVVFERPITQAIRTPYTKIPGYEGFVRTQLAVGKESLRISGTKPVLYTYVGERGGGIVTTFKGYTPPLKEKWLWTSAARRWDIATQPLLTHPELKFAPKIAWKPSQMLSSKIVTIVMPVKPVSISPLVYETLRFGIEKPKSLMKTKPLTITLPEQMERRMPVFEPISKISMVQEIESISRQTQEQETLRMQAQVSESTTKQMQATEMLLLSKQRYKQAAKIAKPQVPIEIAIKKVRYPLISVLPRGMGGRGTRGFDWKMRRQQYKFRKAKIGLPFSQEKKILKEVKI